MGGYLGGGGWAHATKPPCRTQHPLARRFRDSWRVEMKTFRGWVVTALFVFAGGFFGVQSARATASDGTQDWHAFVGLAIGGISAFVVLTLFSYLPFNQNNHWAPTTDQLDEKTPEVHSILILTTQCSHFYKDVECIVKDPKGRKFTARWPGFGGQTQGTVANKSPMMLRYPTEFGAEWPMAGKYKVRWTSGKEKGKRRVTLRRMRWTVSN